MKALNYQNFVETCNPPVEFHFFFQQKSRGNIESYFFSYKNFVKTLNLQCLYIQQKYRDIIYYTSFLFLLQKRKKNRENAVDNFSSFFCNLSSKLFFCKKKVKTKYACIHSIFYVHRCFLLCKKNFIKSFQICKKKRYLPPHFVFVRYFTSTWQ